MQTVKQKIGIAEKIGYGLGDTASNLFFQITIYFIMAFYTKTFGLKSEDVAIMFLLTRVWDAINDPIMGAIADRTRSKWGTYRPYLLWIAVPFGLIFLLTFWSPDLWTSMFGLEFTYTGKLIYAYITYTLMMMVYTAINVPYAALMGVISPSSADRTVISAFRFVLVFIAQFIVQFALLYMVSYFGDGTEASIIGWQRAIMVLSAAASILFLITFFTTRERTSLTVVQKHSFITNIKDLAGNYPWMLIAGATVFQLTFICLRGGDITFYFDEYVKKQEVWGTEISSTVLKTNFLLIGTFFTIAGAVLTKWFTKLLGKSKTYSGFMLLVAISCGLVFFLKPEQVVLLFILNFITSFAMGPVSVLQWAIYTDTADYQEWKNCRRSTAFIMAASLFALKLGVAFGGAAHGWVLALYSYIEPTQEQLLEQTATGVKIVIEQPESAVKGIQLAMSIYPAIAALLAMVFMLFYPLNKARMDEIETELIKRRKESENGIV